MTTVLSVTHGFKVKLQIAFGVATNGMTLRFGDKKLSIVKKEKTCLFGTSLAYKITFLEINTIFLVSSIWRTCSIP